MTENVNNNGQRLASAANNAILMLLARLWVIVSLPVGGWIGYEVISAVKDLQKEVWNMNVKIESARVDIEYLKRDVTRLLDR